MRLPPPALITATLAGTALVVWWVAAPRRSAAEGDRSFAASPQPPPAPMEKVTRTTDEWKKLLTAEQYRVTREAGTEPAFGEAYHAFKQQGRGSYFCVCCGNLLFTSTTRFDSGCGWPSFYDPASAGGIVERKDSSHGMDRIEVLCAKCDAHLGHVFAGEGFKTPTDRRFCINAAALRFVPDAPSAAGPAGTPK